MTTTSGVHARPGTDRAKASVLELTKACISQFERLLAPQSSGRNEALENRLADFSLWADSVGALAKPGASLDSRLTGRVNDLMLVKSVLIMLADSLDYYASLVGLASGSDKSIQNIDSAIKNLALIGVAIRHTGKASRSRRADRTFDPDGHQELRRYLECIILLRPTEDGHCHDDLNPSKLNDVQNRLIEANLRRRHSFLLAQRRSNAQRHAQAQPFVPEVPSTDDLQNRPPTELRNDTSLQASSVLIPTSKGKERAAPTISGFSLASTAEGTLQYSPAAKRYTPGPTKTQITFIASDAEFPRAPSTPRGREISKCPCCCQSLPAETFNNPKIWR